MHRLPGCPARPQEQPVQAIHEAKQQPCLHQQTVQPPSIHQKTIAIDDSKPNLQLIKQQRNLRAGKRPI